MKIKINNKETEVNATTLSELAAELSLPEKGVAVAVNNRMVTRADWNQTEVKEGDNNVLVIGGGDTGSDNIVVIKAVCGG